MTTISKICHNPYRPNTDLLAMMVFCIGVAAIALWEIAKWGSEPTTSIAAAAPQQVARPGNCSILGTKQHKLLHAHRLGQEACSPQ